MNIFHLSDSPYLAAQWQHDRHVVKMTLESAQLLSTAVWHDDTIRAAWTAIYGEPVANTSDESNTAAFRLYKSISNPGHPSAVWVRESVSNFVWTFLHFDGLLSEYGRRFRKTHKCEAIRVAFLPVVARLAGVQRVWTRDANRTLTVDPAVMALADSHSTFNMSMPDQYKESNPVAAYRALYLNEKIFQDHVKWTRCESLPDFIRVLPHDSFGLGLSPRIVARIRALEHAHVNQMRPPAPPVAPDNRPVLAGLIRRFGPAPKADIVMRDGTTHTFK